MTTPPTARCERCGYCAEMPQEGGQYCKSCLHELDDMMAPSYRTWHKCCEIIRKRWLESAPRHLE